MMDWAMKDEDFKVELFRFVDVFPYLSRSESVARHLKQYFNRPNQNFPAALQWGIQALSPGSMAAKVVARSIAKNIENMGRQFIVGETPAEVLPLFEKLRKDGLACTVESLRRGGRVRGRAGSLSRSLPGRFGQITRGEPDWTALGDDSDQVMDWGCRPKVNISVKASAMFSQMNARAFASLGGSGQGAAPSHLSEKPCPWKPPFCSTWSKERLRI